MKKTRKAGSRHTLLFYRHTMDRWRTIAFLLTLIFASLWGWSQFRGIQSLAAAEIWLVIGAIVSLAFFIFAFVARHMAYVQAHGSYLKLVTPFLRLNISYRRISSLHPALVQQLFPLNDAKKAQKKFVEAFHGKTAVVVNLRGYPMNPTLLKLFLPAPMFSPRSTGFVLVVPDWMAFSTELDSFFGSWQQNQSSRKTGDMYHSRQR